MDGFRIRLRRNTALGWSSSNPILEEGEPGFEKDTGKMKIGTGRHRWNDQPYFSSIAVPSDGGVSDAAVLAHINSLTPHPVYDDGPSLTLLYENAKV